MFVIPKCFSHFVYRVPTQNIYTYHYYNTEHVCVPMGTANINASFQGILGCFAVETSNFVLAASLF